MSKQLTAILCVDDETIMTKALKSVLSINLKEVDIIELAQSGEEALEIIEEFKQENIELQVVIADYIMPEMKGDELLVQIHKKYPEIKKIMLTGQSGIEGIKRAINEAQLYRFLEKPWNNDDLILTIKSAIKSYNQNKEIKLQNEELKRLNESLEQKVKQRTQELELMAITDKLTGVYNRGKVEEVLSYEQNRSNRYPNPFGVIMVDIDFFKNINDTLGHQAGDKVLKEITKVFSKNLRKTDTLGRWGGEEFLIVCSQSDLDGILALSHKLKEKLEQHEFGLPNAVTASFGVSIYRGNEKLDDLISRADNALYKAKELGRNRVEYF